MTDEHPLSRLADRGDACGADQVLRDARAESTPTARRPVRLAAAAAAIVALVAGAVALWSNGDEPASLETADPEPKTVTTTSFPPDTTVTEAPQTTVVGFRAVDGILQLTNSGDESTTETTVVGGVRGEEGSTNLAVTRNGTVVFHDRFFSGCRSDIVRTEVDGASDVLVDNAAFAALDDDDARLAYASGSQCTRDGDLLAVRDLASGQTSTLDVNSDDDGLPFRIDDVEWAGDRIAVLAHQYDGDVIAARYLLLYAVPNGGTPQFDSQVLLEDQSRGTLDDFFQNIEPVPGNPDAIVRAVSSSGEGSALEVVNLGSGEAELLLSAEAPITSFSLRTLDDIFYVTSERKVTGERAQVDTLHRRFEDADFVVADDVTSVATAPSSNDPALELAPSAVQEFTSAFWDPGQVQWLEDGRIQAEGYNEFIRSDRPEYTSDPSASALALLGADDSASDVSITESGEAIRVTVTTEISGDDSTSGTQQTLEFETRDGLLEYIDGEWAQRCARGDNTSEFIVGAICP